jgi:A/G-specific adenine glycosylase
MIQVKIQNWYKENGRTFPWRKKITPFRIMIAEFMLQRTKAEQVVPIFIKFIRKFDDIQILSNSSIEEVSKMIKTLGLAWRAITMVEAAKYIIKKNNGIIPDDEKELLKVPGIGTYIAGAILTVCFNKPHPVVDSNIARFINRYYGINLEGEIRRKKQIIEISSQLFRVDKPGELLFSLVDYTSLICKPNKPECKKCVLRNCKNAREGIRGD